MPSRFASGEEKIVVDAGPFIHLGQIGQLFLLKKFPTIYTPTSVINEISRGIETPIEEIRLWNNLTIIPMVRKQIPKIENFVRTFGLHIGETDVIYLASSIIQSIVFTDDLMARTVCGKLGIDVHGTVGVITYAFGAGWISMEEAERNLIALYHESRLFVSYTIIDNAIRQLRKPI